MITTKQMQKDWWVVVKTDRNGNEVTLVSRDNEQDALAAAIDYQQRYGEEEQPELKKYFKY